MVIRSPEVFNIRQAAAFLGAHAQTVRKLARRGAIPAFKVGRDWRFYKEALLRWSEDQQRETGRCSVLVVDDEEMVRRSLGRLLERLGYRVRLAAGGAEALGILEQEAPEVILLDLVMPDMNGPQFLGELRKTQPALPVVIVTGYPESDLVQQATQFAPVMLLSKPVDQELLERTLRTVVGGKVGTNGT